MDNSKLNFIDLFAGAGGLSEGFIKAGFNPIAHVEMDKAATFTLKTRTAYYFLKESGKLNIYESYLKKEINRNELYSLIPEELLNSTIDLPIGIENNKEIQNRINQNIQNKEVDLIIGGPPCQAYSIIGRARSANNMVGDPRNFLYVQYADYLEKYKPKMFVFENVLGLLSAGKGIYLENMRKLFAKKGYSFTEFKVNANDFGVLQNRRRILIVGWLNDFSPNVPDLSKIKIESQALVGSILEDLPKIHAGGGIDKYSFYEGPTNDYLKKSHIRNGSDVLTQHVSRPNNDRDKEIYRIVVDKWNESQKRLNYDELPERLKTFTNHKVFVDKFKIVAKDLGASQTVLAHIAKDGHYYIHPDNEQNRSLTVREAARLQSFPDNFYFEGEREGSNRSSAFKQIGNAVPPLMSFVVAKSINELLCQ
jgi:DNA (cytosine-5)-methyltransferase 1